MGLPSTSRIKIHTSQIRTDYDSIVWLSTSARQELTSCLQLQINLAYCLTDLSALSPAAAQTMLALHPVLVIQHDDNFFPIAGIRSAQVGMLHLERIEVQLITIEDEQAIVALAQSDAYLTPCVISLNSKSAAQQFAAMQQALPDVLANIGTGDLTAAVGWLRENIHTQGSLLKTAELMTEATGEALNADYFLSHLQRRYVDNV